MPQNTREEKAAYMREYRARRPESIHRQHLKSTYGISLEDYDRMAANGCNICGAVANTDGRRLYVDHCHETNKVRGVLCQQCNHGLGHFKDNPELLVAAAFYLENS